MWHLVLFVIVMVVLAVVVSRMTKKKKAVDATYICDVCGEKHCECRVDEK